MYILDISSCIIFCVVSVYIFLSLVYMHNDSCIYMSMYRVTYVEKKGWQVEDKLMKMWNQSRGTENSWSYLINSSGHFLFDKSQLFVSLKTTFISLHFKWNYIFVLSCVACGNHICVLHFIWVCLMYVFSITTHACFIPIRPYIKDY